MSSFPRPGPRCQAATDAPPPAISVHTRPWRFSRVNFNEAPGTTPRHNATPRHCEAVEKCRGHQEKSGKILRKMLSYQWKCRFSRPKKKLFIVFPCCASRSLLISPMIISWRHNSPWFAWFCAVPVSWQINGSYSGYIGILWWVITNSYGI